MPSLPQELLEIIVDALAYRKNVQAYGWDVATQICARSTLQYKPSIANLCVAPSLFNHNHIYTEAAATSNIIAISVTRSTSQKDRFAFFARFRKIYK